jgi:ketosteroid isomerase-like protein
MDAEKLIADFFTFFNSRDLDRLRPLLTETAQFYFPKTQPLLSPDRILKFLHVLFRQYPELVFTVQQTIVQDDRAAVHWTNRGKNRRGEPYENEGLTLLEFEAGKIAFISDFFKDTGKF